MTGQARLQHLLYAPQYHHIVGEGFPLPHSCLPLEAIPLLGEMSVRTKGFASPLKEKGDRLRWMRCFTPAPKNKTPRSCTSTTVGFFFLCLSCYTRQGIYPRYACGMYVCLAPTACLDFTYRRHPLFHNVFIKKATPDTCM